jgi:hypothetical protein
VGEAPLPYFYLKYIFLNVKKVLKKEGCHFTIFKNLTLNGKKASHWGALSYLSNISIYNRGCIGVFDL